MPGRLLVIMGEFLGVIVEALFGYWAIYLFISSKANKIIF